MAKIPLDINKPGTPMEVLHSVLSAQIVDMCKNWRIDIPEALKAYVEEHDHEAGYNWEFELLDRSEEMSTELIHQWVEAMPGGLCRAELRGIYIRRLNDHK